MFSYDQNIEVTRILYIILWPGIEPYENSQEHSYLVYQYPVSIMIIKFCSVFGVTAFLVFLVWPGEVSGKSQYVMPLLGGMKMSLPYDIANIFIRPIGRSIAVFLSICMLFILFFGVITSPFGYMFGIPSRKYVLGPRRDPTDPAIPRSLDFDRLNSSWSFTEGFTLPEFEFEPFSLLPPEIMKRSCKQLALCHAHQHVTRLPSSILRAIRWLSQNLIEMSPESEEAIKAGLSGKVTCDDAYTDCDERIYTIIIKTVQYWLPASLKNHNHRRKKAMYMS